MTAAPRCHLCAITFLNEPAWRDHLSRFHTSRQGDIRCTLCGHLFLKEVFAFHSCVERVFATDKARRHPSLASAGGPPPHPPTRGSAGPVPFVLRPLPSADEPHVGAPGRRSIEGDAS